MTKRQDAIIRSAAAYLWFRGFAMTAHTIHQGTKLLPTCADWTKAFATARKIHSWRSKLSRWFNQLPLIRQYHYRHAVRWVRKVQSKYPLVELRGGAA